MKSRMISREVSDEARSVGRRARIIPSSSLAKLSRRDDSERHFSLKIWVVCLLSSESEKISVIFFQNLVKMFCYHRGKT